MDASSNLAYDYKQFEEKEEPQIRTVSSNAASRVKTKSHSAMLAKAICCMTVVILMLSALIYTNVVQSELNDDFNEAQKTLNSLKGENSRLQIQMEQNFSQDTIEEIARTELKMEELDNAKIEYISVNNQDKARVMQSPTFMDSIKSWILGIIG